MSNFLDNDSSDKTNNDSFDPDSSFPFPYHSNIFDSVKNDSNISLDSSQRGSQNIEELTDSKENNNIYSKYISDSKTSVSEEDIIQNVIQNENFVGKNKTVKFTNTKAYKSLKNFIYSVDNSIKTETQINSTNQFLIDVDEIIENTPLSTEPARFANAAMKTVIDKIYEITDNMYLRESLGNKIRMDFGTGHELNFLCYLCTLYQSGDIKLNYVFPILKDYFRIVRKYLRKFNVEAAGARGCWSVDDYQLLPYVFGSSENFKLTTKINYIFSGAFYEAWSFREPTGLLKGICTLDWPTINIKMLDLYDKEVFQKHVVTQHFIYSKYLSDEYDYEELAKL